jgi:hypothetical protein
MKKYFNDEELSKLPLFYNNFYADRKHKKQTFSKTIASSFYQNNLKKKIRIIAKPISRLFHEDNIF